MLSRVPDADDPPCETEARGVLEGRARRENITKKEVWWVCCVRVLVWCGVVCLRVWLLFVVVVCGVCCCMFDM